MFYKDPFWPILLLKKKNSKNCDCFEITYKQLYTHIYTLRTPFVTEQKNFRGP